jgi:hypothetical protein
MAPNRSPFGLFMIKMKDEDKSLRNKSMDQIVKYCNEIYINLKEDKRHEFQTLSQFIRQNNCNDFQIRNCLKRIQINSQNNNNNNNWINSELNFSFTKFREKTEKFIDSSDEEMDKQLISDYERVKNAIERHKDLNCLSFIVISFNVSLQTFDGVYYPNEVALTQFTLKEGVQQSYHKLIYNQIPQGFQWTAQQFADKSHKLPLNPRDKEFERNYDSLFDDIFDFMAFSDLIDSKGKKLVFCQTVDSNGHESVPQVVGCLKWIENKLSVDRLNERSFANFKVIDLSELLFVLTKPYINRAKSLFIDDLSKSIYDFIPEINCDFHKQLENKYCALGLTKRLCYLLFDSFFSFYNKSDLKSTENHRPIEQKYAVNELSTFQFRQNKTLFRRQDRYYSNADNKETQTQASTSSQLSKGINNKKSGEFRNPHSVGIGRGKIGSTFRRK